MYAKHPAHTRLPFGACQLYEPCLRQYVCTNSLPAPLSFVPRSGTQDWQQQSAILDDLKRGGSATKLLFITPEKLARSDKLMRVIDAVHQAGKLDRCAG